MATKVQELIALIQLQRRWRSSSRPIAALLVAAVLVLGFAVGPATEVRAETGLRLDVKPGLDGYARHGTWLPVTITAVNSGGADFTGTVVLRTFEDYDPRATEWRRDFTVAAGGEAQTVFYVPAAQAIVQAELLGPGGKSEATAQARLQFRDGVIAGVIASNPDTLRLLGGVELRPSQQQGGRPSMMTVVRPEAHDLPTFSRALGALDILAFNDTSSQDLTADQWAAIEAWVGQGGVLILGGGPGWRQTLAAVPETLRPVEVTGTTTLNGLPALAAYAGEELPEQPVVVSDGRLRHGRIVVEEAGVPLIVESRYGEGYIFYTAFDLGLDPVAFWRGGAPMWRQLLGPAVAVAPYIGGRPGSWGSDLQWIVRQFPHLGFPSTRTLAFVLIAYLVLVGPVNYIVLKRLDRRDLMWVTVPALVAVITAGIYGISFRGNRDVLTNSIGVMHLVPGAERVASDTVVGVYAPTRSRLRFRFSPRQHVAPVLDWNRWATVTAQQVVATVRQGADNEIEFGDGSNWTVRSFTVMQDVDAGGTIEGVLRPTASGEIGGTITNNTQYDLEDVHVVLVDTFISVGDLPAGATRTISAPVRAQLGQTYRDDIAFKIYGPQPPNYEIVPERQYRQQILNNAFNRYPDGRPHPVTFLGWTKQPLTDLNFDGRAEQHASLSLVYGALEFALPTEDFVLPEGLIVGQVYDSDMQGGWYGGGVVAMESGWVAVSVQLPTLPAGIELAELALTVNRLGHNANLLSFALYNWQTGDWDAVAVAQDKINVPDLAAYVYDGEVRLRVELQQQGHVEFPLPSAIVTGKKVVE